MDILGILKQHTLHNQPAIIAIDGRSAAGKTTLASNFARELNAVLIHADDYFLPEERKTEERLKEPGGNIDYERLYEEVFMHIKDDEITSYHFNCNQQVLEDRKAQKNTGVIIVEGAYALHPSLYEFYTYRIFVTISKETQKKRILKRNGEYMLNRFVTEWIPLEEAYIESLQILDKVDTIINNE